MIPMDPNMVSALAERARVRRVQDAIRRQEQHAREVARAAVLEARAAVLEGAVQHPTRALIVKMLAEQRLPAAIIASRIGCSITTTRWHLRRLQEAGVVTAIETDHGAVWQLTDQGDAADDRWAA